MPCFKFRAMSVSRPLRSCRKSLRGTSRRCMRTGLLSACIALAAFALSAASASATPYCHACPYDCSDLGLGRKDCSFLSDARGTCCVDLTQKGLELAEARERAEGGNRGGYHNNNNNNSRNERCPAGFSPSEQKCSPDERRRGCKDIRLPNGLGCVRR